MACMKSRWVPSTRESSNPAISAFRWSVRKCSGSKSVWVTSIKALNGASLNCRCSAVTDWRRASPAILPSHFRGLIARHWKGWRRRICPPRANWLRALALELERLANHLGDLGAIGNDAGFAFGLAQFSRLKEQLLRATEQALGQRYLMDFIVPGGTRVDLSSTEALLLLESDRIDHRGGRTHCVRSMTNTRDCATGLWGRASSRRRWPRN